MRILVATDGSDPAAIGCEQARSLATLAHGEIRIVAVQPPAVDLFGGPWPAAAAFDPRAIELALRQQLEQRVEHEAARTPADLRPTTVVLEGRPAVEIVAEAVRWQADLVVVGSRGHGALSSILVGSVSEEVVDRSPVPVLVARRPGVRRVAVAVDDSPASRSAVEFLGVGPTFHGLDARIVDVVPGRYPWWVGMSTVDGESIEQMAAMIDAAERRQGAAAEAAVDALRDAGMTATAERRVGDAADEIIRAAIDFDADVIAIGSRGQKGVTRLVLGSVARHVLRHAAASVLIVHPPVVTTRPVADRPVSAAAPGSTGAGRPTQPVDQTEIRKESPMKILLAYDGGEPARHALDTAARLATAMGGTIDVISVVPVHTGRAPIDPWDDRDVHLRELEDARARLNQLGIPCRLLIPGGDPAEEIEATAKAGDYDTIVVGSRRQGVLGRMLQGSVSEHVATHAEATVVVAR